MSFVRLRRGRRCSSTVAEFAADLQRYLDGMPVKARRDTITYRARKFVRRHRTGVAAAVTLVATLAAGVARRGRSAGRGAGWRAGVEDEDPDLVRFPGHPGLWGLGES